MKILIGLLIERFGSFFAKIVGLMSKKAALVALIAAMSVMVVTFTAALTGILANLTTGMNQPLVLFREFNFEVRHSPMPPDGTLRIP